jgi:hypothetical protein
MSDAKQYPERERRARRAAPDGIEPVADARGTDLGLVLHMQLAWSRRPRNE